MRRVLEQLSAQPGIIGALVTTTDGVVVDASLDTGLDEDVAAALVSSLLTGTMGLLGGCGTGMDQLVLRASRGKVIVNNLGNAYLVVVLDRKVDIDSGLLEIKSAAKHLQRLGRIAV